MTPASVATRCGTILKVQQDRPALLELLAGSQVFSGLGEKTLADVLAIAQERRIVAGEVAFREGEPADSFCVVVAGRLKLTQVGQDGNEVILRFVGPGEVAAALAVFVEATYPATALAMGPTQLLAWQRVALQELIQSHAVLATNMLRLVSERLRELQERFRELAAERVAQRIARALLRLVRQAGRKVEHGVLIDMPLSRQDLAEMTGTTLFTVSRTLSDWEAQGFVESARERVMITRPHALVSIAEDLPPSPSAAERPKHTPST